MAFLQDVPRPHDSRTRASDILERGIHVGHTIPHETDPVRVSCSCTTVYKYDSFQFIPSKRSHPATVNSSPPTTNFCPDTFTNPDGVGVGALPAEEDIVLGTELEETVLGGGGGAAVVDATPGRH